MNPPEIIPDYNAGIDVAANTEFNVPANGMLAVSVFHYQLLKRIYTIVGIELFRKIELNDCHKEQGVYPLFFYKNFFNSNHSN